MGAPNPEAYVVHDDGTVTDDLTGLMWQEAPQHGAYTWAEADSYCTSLTLATYGDWRLPTFIELVSILDYSQIRPAISPTAFPGTPWIDLWSSTPFAGDAFSAREVYFSTGDTGHDGVSATNDVRCARGPAGTASQAIPPTRYTIGSGIVHDIKTGLTWQQSASAQTFAWADAKGYCANLGASAAVGWRLPTVKELLTIVDVTDATVPTIDCAVFPDAPAGDLWSATPLAGSSSVAWAVSFYDGHTISRDVSTLDFVRCVQ